MADTITAKANVGAGTDPFYVDLVDGNNVPVTKILLGADNVDGGFVTNANPLPVSDAGGSITVDGTVTANAGTGTFAVSGPLTDAQLRASAVSVLESDPADAVSFGPITAANTVLFTAVDTAHEAMIQLQLAGRFDDGGIRFEASNDNTNWHSVPVSAYSDDQLVDVVYSPDLITTPLPAKYFRAITMPDFSGSVTGHYVLRNTTAPQRFTNTKLVDVAPDLLLPVAGVTPTGYVKRIAVADSGGFLPADTTFTGTRLGTQVGPIVTVDTTGYNSVAMQLGGTFTGTITFQASNDGSTWASVAAWPVAGGTAPVTTATAVGQWLIPAAGRFIRAQITTAGTGQPLAIATLKNASAFYPASTPSVTIAANSAVNIAQVGGTATAAGGLPILASGATSGASVGTLIAAGTNNLTQIKGTIGRLFFFHIQNQVASVRYLKLFSLPSASVTMGTTNATMNFVIPASGTLSLNIPSVGLNMGGTGISFALTTGSALNDNTAVTAGDLIVNYSWA